MTGVCSIAGNVRFQVTDVSTQCSGGLYEREEEMTSVEIFKISQEIDDRLAEMADGDPSVRRQRRKDIRDLVTQLCIALSDANEALSRAAKSKTSGIDVM